MHAQRNVPYVVLFLVHHRQVYSEESLDLDAGLQQGACVIAVRTVQVKHVRTVYRVQRIEG
jgi:predicted transcriptional regulator